MTESIGNPPYAIPLCVNLVGLVPGTNTGRKSRIFARIGPLHEAEDDGLDRPIPQYSVPGTFKRLRCPPKPQGLRFPPRRCHMGANR